MLLASEQIKTALKIYCSILSAIALSTSRNCVFHFSMRMVVVSSSIEQAMDPISKGLMQLQLAFRC